MSTNTNANVNTNISNIAKHPEQAPMFDLLFFGGTGDLAMRKLLPSLFMAHSAGTLHPKGRIWGLSRQQLTTEQYLDILEKEVRTHAKVADASQEVWQSFCQRIHYQKVDVTELNDFNALKTTLDSFDNKQDVIAYLAITPKLFEVTCKNLVDAKLDDGNMRVVLEKPMGTDLASSNAINDAVAQYFHEQQLYRIDHYLGKESVQNLLMLRFSNILFEPLWKNEWIDNVQITIAEDLGVEGRGGFYDGIGALRDMMQNHLLQLVCMVAMEPPASMDADSIRSEKLKVLKSLRPMTAIEDINQNSVRGQYTKGIISRVDENNVVNDSVVPAYRDEPNVNPNSQTETFVAIKAHIDNWRWAGVPFYLRTGKRMQEKFAEIVITFKDVPHKLFSGTPQNMQPNRMVIRLQPDESIRLYVKSKKLGNSMEVQRTFLNLNFHEILQGRRTSAYERLLQDVIESRLPLFVHRDEQAAAWQWVEPIMEAWAKDEVPLYKYSAGSYGPVQSYELIAKDGRTWKEDVLM